MISQGEDIDPVQGSVIFKKSHVLFVHPLRERTLGSQAKDISVLVDKSEPGGDPMREQALGSQEGVTGCEDKQQKGRMCSSFIQ